MAENYKFVNYAGAEMAELFNKMADLDVATQSKAGLMSATDKTKLDELPAGAQVNVLEGVQLAGTDLSISGKKVNIPVDNAPTEGSSALIRSGAVHSALAVTNEELSQLGQEVIYDVTMNNPTAGPNNDGKFESLSALLSDENLSTLIPSTVRCGGMSIRFAQTSDNNYVQYRLMADAWSADTEDWVIADEGVYVENPEFVYVKADAEGKILWAIKVDGSIYYGTGCPPQIIDYINEKIADLSLDEYEDIVAFLSDYLGSDTTLKVLIDGINASLEDKLDAEGLDSDALGTVQIVENPEFIEAKTDSEGKLLAGRTLDGAAFENVGFSAPKVSTESVDIDGYIVKNIEDPEGRTEIKTDAEGKILSYRDGDGVMHENVGITTPHLNLVDDGMTEFQKALKASGFSGGQGDWSDYISNGGDNPLHIPIPQCANLNIITDKDLTQLSKKGYTGSPAPVEGVNYDVPTQVEFWDMQGNYFKKWTLMSAQGSSSMTMLKKNLAFDFFDTEEDARNDGDAFAIKFGDWVPQDSFHLKAYYTDFFRGIAITSYGLAMDIENSYDFNSNRNWKRAIVSNEVGDCTYNNRLDKSVKDKIDSGARCMPDGFPVIVYRNGEFYGIFSWQIKKHRDNYQLISNKAEHIHLDGVLGVNTIFNGSIDWTQFEVRNPKKLVYAEAHNGTYKYDSDLPGQFEIAGNNDGGSTYDVWSNSVSGYTVGKIVKHIITINSETKEHLFLNTIANNDKEPAITYNANKNEWYNTDDNPDFKNKTKSGWLNVTNTVKVKEYIIALSKRCAEIDNEALVENKKTLFETYFDAENLIDYSIVQGVVADYDAVTKNWQWITWDGVKWFVNEYDKDCTFGGNASGDFITQPNMDYPNGDYLGHFNSGVGPIKYVSPGYIDNYYNALKKNRYTELRSLGIISVKNIINKLALWVNRIGVNNYEKEFSKWDDCICNRNMVLNSPWILYQPANAEEYNSIDLYDPSTTYNAGDKCKISNYLCFQIPNDYSGSVIDVIPYIKKGHTDNLYRVENWIKERIRLLDVYTNYNQ